MFYTIEFYSISNYSFRSTSNFLRSCYRPCPDFHSCVFPFLKRKTKLLVPLCILPLKGMYYVETSVAEITLQFWVLDSSSQSVSPQEIACAERYKTKFSQKLSISTNFQAYLFLFFRKCINSYEGFRVADVDYYYYFYCAFAIITYVGF